jgi:predicted nucleic acid-binding protein
MNPKVCVDASVVLRWILPNSQESATDTVLSSWVNRESDLISSPLLDIEITAAIKKLADIKRISPHQGEDAYALYRELHIEIMKSNDIMKTVWRLISELEGVNLLDLEYLAVAELADSELWTADKKLFAQLKDRSPRVRFAGELTDNTRVEPKKTTKSDFPGLWRVI